MKTSITLRQHKILLYLLDRKTYVTGDEIASSLGITSRTVRTDISQMIPYLIENGINITSIRGQGYFLPSETYPKVREMLKADNAFFDQTDRMRYLALQLCLSDGSLNIYDLEDELSVSHATLLNDIKLLKKAFVYSRPFIGIISEHNTVRFEDDELKRREILTHLMRENWDYNTSGNAYYGHDFLDWKEVRLIINSCYEPLKKYNIYLEDSAFIAISLSIAIASYRIRNGKLLSKTSKISFSDSLSRKACNEILDCISESLCMTFPETERHEIYNKFACCRSLSPEELNEHPLSYFFSSKTFEVADLFLYRINDAFGISLSEVEGFRVILLSFIHQLQQPYIYLKDPEIITIVNAKLHFFVEYEFAYLFQLVCHELLSRHIDETETLYLVQALSGALIEYSSKHPENRLNAIILCHLNSNVRWAIEQKINHYFSDVINVKCTMPIYKKANYDFSGIDTLIVTNRKKIKESGEMNVLYCSALMDSDDFNTIESHVQDSYPERFYHQKIQNPSEILKNAFFHESRHFSNPFELIEFMANDFLRAKAISYSIVYDMLQRESTLSYVFMPSLVLIYSLFPAEKTMFSVVTLDDNMIWKGERIHIAVMFSLTKEDTYKIFSIKKAFYKKYYDEERLKHINTIDELLTFYKEYDLQ